MIVRKIPIIGLSLFLIAPMLIAAPRRHFKLPAEARVHIGSIGVDKGYTDVDVEQCQGFRVTEREIRHRFRTYHETKQGEIHDYYLWFPCWVEGSITFHDKTFTWQARAGNLMFTDFPDGVEHSLGGKHDDDPSGQ